MKTRPEAQFPPFFQHLLLKNTAGLNVLLFFALQWCHVSAQKTCKCLNDLNRTALFGFSITAAQLTELRTYRARSACTATQRSSSTPDQNKKINGTQRGLLWMVSAVPVSQGHLCVGIEGRMRPRGNILHGCLCDVASALACCGHACLHQSS